MKTDVVVAGAGPNGLMLACELALNGIRPLVLERLPEPTLEQRANALVGQVAQVLDRRGLHARLTGTEDPPRPAPGYVFGALPLELASLGEHPLAVLPVPQPKLTAVIAARAVELGVEIRYAHEVLGFTQDDDAVTVDVAGPDSGYQIRARYLVGADGGHSVVRKRAGIDFPGITTANMVSRSANALLPERWLDPAHGVLRVPGYGPIPMYLHHRTERGMFVYLPLPDRPPLVLTREWEEPAATGEPMSLAELAASASRVLGVDVPLTPVPGLEKPLLRRLSGDNTRLAGRYRDRRVLLAGDAAHVHPAIGGPGLNLGLQDTVNLGWKLAAAVAGWAPPGLLDSYEAERRPAAERVVMHTQAQVALIAPGSDVTALRQLFTELLQLPENRRHIAGLMAGSDVVCPTPCEHPLAGHFAPDVDLGTGARLGELARTARPLLLDLTPDAAVAGSLHDWKDRVDVVTARAEYPATAALIRPDGYVAWATSSAEPDDAELAGLAEAARHWFGDPA